MKYVDPEGKVIETAWDFANVIMDAYSLYDNILQKNYKAAAVDAGAFVLDAAATALPAVPAGFGTALKAARTSEKAVKLGEKAIGTVKNTVHGNSKASTNAQHVYEIYDVATNKTVKVGISGGKISSKSGKSYRAQKQVNRFNKDAMGQRTFDSEIIEHIPEGKGARERALMKEKKYANTFRENNELEKMYHQRP